MTDINPYFKSHIHENNILEIEYTTNKLDCQADQTVRNEIKQLYKNIGKKIILVLNLKNIKYIDSAAIGATISAWKELKKQNGEKSLIYCINLNSHIIKIYNLVNLNHNILLLNFDNIKDIIEIEKYKNNIIKAFYKTCMQIIIDKIKSNTREKYMSLELDVIDVVNKKNEKLYKLWLELFRIYYNN